MPSMKDVISNEQAQMELRRSPSLVEDRLEEVQALSAILIEAAQNGNFDPDYVTTIVAHFQWNLNHVVKFGKNAAQMVQREREARRDAVAEFEHLTNANSGLLALVDHLQTNLDEQKQQAVNEALEKLAEFYGANVDELLQALKDAADAA